MKMQYIVLNIFFHFILIINFAFSAEKEPFYIIDFLNPSKPNITVYIYKYKNNFIYCKDLSGKIHIFKCSEIENILLERRESKVIKEVLKSSIIKGGSSGIGASIGMYGAIWGATGVSVFWPIIFVPMFMSAVGAATYYDMQEPIDKTNKYCK